MKIKASTAEGRGREKKGEKKTPRGLSLVNPVGASTYYTEMSLTSRMNGMTTHIHTHHSWLHSPTWTYLSLSRKQVGEGLGVFEL